MPKEKPKPRIDFTLYVTALELAHILGISEGELFRLTRANVLRRETQITEKKRVAVYAWVENVHRYVRHLREPRERAREEFENERHETQRIIRAQKQLEYEIACGDTISRSRVVSVMQNLVSTLKNHVLAIPVRVTRKLIGQTSATKINATLRAECKLALREMTDFDVKSFNEMSKNGQRSHGHSIKRQRERAQS